MDARPLSDMFCEYFLQDYGLLIHFLNSVFDEQGLLILIKPNLSVFCVCVVVCVVLPGNVNEYSHVEKSWAVS